MAKKNTLIYCDKYGCYINAERLIDEGSTPLPELQEQFEEFSASNPDSGTYFEDEEEFMTGLGYKSLARDNTYNTENDLDANVVWQVWGHPEYDERRNDWVSANSDIAEDGLPILVSTFAFNHGDPRGGYTAPLFRTGEFSDGSYSICADTVVGYYFMAKRKGDARAEAEADELNEKGEYQAGYHSNPSYQLEKDFKVVRDPKGRIFVTTDSGAKLIADPDYSA
jgi:hypothetical protein